MNDDFLHQSQQQIPPHSIDEISALFEDLALEIYFGANFKHVLMNCSDSTIAQLKQIVEQAKSDRLQIPERRRCYCLSLFQDHYAGDEGCEYEPDFTHRDK